MLGMFVYGLRAVLGDYRALRRLAHSGKPIPGEIINVQPVYRVDTADIKISAPCQNGGREPHGVGFHDGCDGPWSSGGSFTHVECPSMSRSLNVNVVPGSRSVGLSLGCARPRPLPCTPPMSRGRKLSFLRCSVDAAEPWQRSAC